MSPATTSMPRNFALLTAGQLMSRLLAFGVSVYLTRTLLAEGFGDVVLATSLLAYAALIVDLGFDALGPLEVARGRIGVEKLAGTVVTLRAVLAILAVGALASFAVFASVPGSTRIVILLYGLSLLTNALSLNWVFLGDERMWPVAVAEVLQQGTMLIGLLLLVRGPRDLLIVPLVFFISRLAVILWLERSFARRFGSLRLGIDRTVLKRLLPATLPFSGSAIVGAFLQHFDIVLLGLWLGSHAAGIYGAAYRVAWVPTLIATAYVAALRPSMARAALAGPERVGVLLRRSLRLNGALGLGVLAGGLSLAAPLIRALFGAAYAAAAGPLAVMCGSFALLALSRPFRLVLVSYERQATDLRIMTAAAASNVVLNLVLVPLAGPLGAAAATLASEALILLLCVIATRPLVTLAALVGLLARPVVCAAALGIALVTTATLPLLPRLALAGFLYTTLLIGSRVITIKEIRALLGR